MTRAALAIAAVLLATPVLASDDADDTATLVRIMHDRTLAICGWRLDEGQAKDMIVRRTVSIEQLAREVCVRAARLRRQVPLEGKFLR